MRKIVVLGAGYAGLAAAVSLAARTKRRDDVRITVVNAAERFTERLRLHQTAAGEDLADLRIPELLTGTGAEFVCGWVTGVDAAARNVRVDDERVLEYDTLVYALGSVSDTSAVPGVDDHAYTLDSAHNAETLARRLDGLGDATVAVCGSGLTGVEAAAEIAEQHPALRVVLIGREEPGAVMGPRAKAYMHASLERLGVQVRSGVEIIKVLPDGVELAGGESVAADAVLWTSGVRVSPLAAAAGLQVDERGRIVTDSALRSVSHPEVYAIGDAAAVQQTYGLIHGTCQSSMPTAVHAAVSVVREMSGKQPKPFRFGYIHVPVSLGRNDAVIQFTHPDDSPKRLCLTGRRAVWYKETVSSAPWPAFRRLIKHPAAGSFAWRRGGRYTR
ncbi:NAD(P)/FAD-dependent oxidoreductase [Actinocrispum wychmicini]|uniref:NADH dehydrogenase FAD-containing subunit n=1 Tax=Actinocrispum wychmicini TaxID=1213861 RepID=A0A4R2K342_9PSEU|nr:FAD-dependent oxidoreductase [Actinocrispum wychmicini]TCO60715.1 NADH dehydrogenase FAD-containing subunit [Actinocrispum wychmicini]